MIDVVASTGMWGAKIKQWSTLLFLAGSLSVAGCGGDDDDDDEPGDDDDSSTEITTPPSGDDDSPAGDDDASETGDDDASETGDDDASETGDDDASETGDDDASEPGDDDASEPGDDDASEPGDDDASEPGDDDASETGDDDTEIDESPAIVDNDRDGASADVDCNDNNAAIYPGATEVCDQLDNDCDSIIDEETPDADVDGIPDCSDACPNDAQNDQDDDLVCGNFDNCEAVANNNQMDTDQDGAGDVCDSCPADDDDDADGDAYCADDDNCPSASNSNQADTDEDAVGDACDNCVDVANADQADSNQDGTGNACADCLEDASNDPDHDLVCSTEDNCPADANENQMDRDLDGAGDVCDVCPNDSPNANEDGVCGDNQYIPADDASFYIYGTVPDNNFQAVAPDDIEGGIYFSEAYAGSNDKIHIQVVSQYGDVQDLPPVFTSSDKTVAQFFPELLPDTDYCAVIEVDYQSSVNGVWPVEYASCFTTTAPCGVAIDVGYNVIIEELGDTSAASLRLMNASLADYNDFEVALLFENFDGSEDFPQSSFGASYGGFVMEDGANRLRDEGYTTQLENCTIDNSGNFYCEADSIIFPVYFDGYDDGTFLYLEDGVITAKVQTEGDITTMTEYLLEAIITQDSIDRIAATLSGELDYDLSSLVELNVDTDGDGTDDAATYVLSTEPQAVDIVGTECSD